MPVLRNATRRPPAVSRLCPSRATSWAVVPGPAGSARWIDYPAKVA
ncbi:hypothetical protein [Nonomuraea sp. NPDC005650]